VVDAYAKSAIGFSPASISASYSINSSPKYHSNHVHLYYIHLWSISGRNICASWRQKDQFPLSCYDQGTRALAELPALPSWPTVVCFLVHLRLSNSNNMRQPVSICDRTGKISLNLHTTIRRFCGWRLLWLGDARQFEGLGHFPPPYN